MYQQDLYQYIQWLQSSIQSHEKRIAALESAIQKMQLELKQIDEKKTIHVDRIEYKFDQLKVETLEGTLTIGLNPNDLSGIEDFAVQNQTLNTPLTPKAQMQRSLKIEEAIYHYLETDLPRIVEETEQKLQIQPNESYLSFIKQDILKQLPSRIDYYLKAAAQTGSREESQAAGNDESIIETIKQEIQNGVFAFLSHLPENMKGMKPV